MLEISSDYDGMDYVCFYMVEVTLDEFGMSLFPSVYLVFSFFLVLFMNLIVLFSTIYESHCTIKLTFNFFLNTLLAKKIKF